MSKVRWNSVAHVYLTIAALGFSSILATGSASLAWASSAQFGVAPDNNLNLLSATLSSAQSEVLVNMYELKSWTIANALIALIDRGIKVQVLLEGQPVGGWVTTQKSIAQSLQQAMAAHPRIGNNLFIMANLSDVHARRYVYDHAKYVVVDGVRSLISSENFASTGHPESGYVGNRGWDVVLNDLTMAQQLRSMFVSDTATTHGDIINYAGGTLAIPSHADSLEPAAQLRGAPAESLGTGSVTSAKLITSPQSQAALVALIASARSSLSVEELDLPANFGTQVNPLVDAILAAARRGVHVQVILNDDNVFASAAVNFLPSALAEPRAASRVHGNLRTVQLLRTTAACEHLALDAKIIDVSRVELTYVHNKGILVDNQQALVSSINGTSNSMANNREVAVLLQSSAAATYFGRFFAYDWQNSSLSPPTNLSCH